MSDPNNENTPIGLDDFRTWVEQRTRAHRATCGAKVTAAQADAILDAIAGEVKADPALNDAVTVWALMQIIPEAMQIGLRAEAAALRKRIGAWAGPGFMRAICAARAEMPDTSGRAVSSLAADIIDPDGILDQQLVLALFEDLCAWAVPRGWRRIDPEKLSDTPLQALHVRGVEITSRYQKKHELLSMAEAITLLPEAVAGQIKSIWCDSKACCCYGVTIRRHEPDFAWAIARALDHAFCALDGGHNGISVGATGGNHVADADPNWPFEGIADDQGEDHEDAGP